MTTIDIPTDHSDARDVLARIEVLDGRWTAYGNDGRVTTDEIDNARQEKAGDGYRARFIDNPHGGDYGWGPLGRNALEAVALLLAERVAGLEPDAA